MKMSTIKKVLDPILENEKIKLPSGVKRVKLDVGTSRNAPFSEFWLQNDNDLCVFGFEPNVHNIENIKKPSVVGSYQLKTHRINKNFFCVNCALSNFVSDEELFYCAEDDSGTSSLFKPKEDGDIKIKEVTNVPVITLESFFDLFPWDIVDKIDQIKIDAQSSDYNIIKGMGRYLSEKVVYLDVETSTENQYENIENPEEIKSYMESQGFECLKWGLDSTFLNKKYISSLDQVRYSTLH